MNRHLTKIVLPLVIAAAASTGLVFAGLSARTSVAKTDSLSPALLVNTARIQLLSGYDYKRELTGRAQARRVSELGFELGGRLVDVLVDEGDQVSEGEVVAELDSDRLQAQRRELDAARGEAEADLALAKLTSERLADIVDRGGVSRQDLDDAHQAWRAAIARSKRVERQIDVVEVDLAKTRLHAPFSGIVTGRHADEGRVLAAGAPVLSLHENTVPEIRVGVVGRLVDYLRPGEIYRFGWRGKVIEARLRAVLPMRSAIARTVDALFDPVAAPSGLRPGDLLRLELRERIDEPGFWLPIGALTKGLQGLWSIYVTRSSEGSMPAGLDATHQIVRRTVSIIHQETDRVYVRGTLQATDHVVLDGLQRLVPRQWVRANPVADYKKDALARIAEGRNHG